MSAEFARCGPWRSLLEHKTQVRALRALRQQLPGLDAPLRQVAGRALPGRVKKLSTAQVGRLVEGHEAGATVYELGERFGISRQTVGKILKRRGVKIRMQGLFPEQVDQAVSLYEAGCSLARIGERLGVDHGTVWNRLRERGVRMRDTHGRER